MSTPDLELPAPRNGKRLKRRAFLILAIDKYLSDQMLQRPSSYTNTALDNNIVFGPIVLTMAAGDPLPRYLYGQAGECLPNKPIHILSSFTNGTVLALSPETSVNCGVLGQSL
jgi:hypothetical protein